MWGRALLPVRRAQLGWVIWGVAPMNRFAILLILMCLASDSLAADTWIIRYEGAGPVKIGMTLAQLSATLHEKLSEQESGSEDCFYVTAPGHDHIGFMIVKGRLVRIDVTAPGIATASGFQVGDSEARALKIYGLRMKVTPHQYVDTGHYLTIRSTDGHYGIRFETDQGKITGYYAGTYEAIQYVEGCE
jgi:hypothetical protein